MTMLKERYLQMSLQVLQDCNICSNFHKYSNMCRGVSKCFEVGIRLCKPCDCEKFIKGQKVIVLTTVTRNMLLIRGQKSSGHWLVLKSLYVN